MDLTPLRRMNLRAENIPVPRARRLPIGQLLVERGELAPADQLHVLGLQSRVDASYGRILLARGLVDRARLYAAIAQQHDTYVADLIGTPPAPWLADSLGAKFCLQNALLPWRRVGGQMLIAAAQPKRFAAVRAQLESLFGPVRMVIAPECDIHRALMTMAPKALTQRAEARVPAEESCRCWPSRTLPRLFGGLGLLLILSLLLVPAMALVLLAVWALLTLFANSLLKLAAAIAQVRAIRSAGDADHAPAPVIARLPAVSLLVPLYEETAIAHRLIERLQRIEYPKELLDICLIVEADDAATRATLAMIELPPYMRQITVPFSTLKTKPRALNYALDFCRGDIIGVYDAEDSPAPDQIYRVVQRFYQRGPEVACLQGVLDFYNTRRNWMARCFTIEYAAWFRVILPGLARLGLVVPLGGTTLFFRRNVLEQLGGWDAHNVTEDADLGVRLARHGYRTELIDTVTLEEANCRFWPWVKQRSRWLKGYAITWAVHMRHPRKLWSDLGAWRFLGIQLLFLGTISQFLLAPILWSLWMITFGLPHPMAWAASSPLIWTSMIAFLLSELVNIAIGIYAVRDAQHRYLIRWVPTLYFYFPMAALASFKGMLELLTRPFFWDKTTHGLYDAPSPQTEAADPHSPEPEADADPSHLVIQPDRPRLHPV
ncbi:MAG: glycosyltransferase [Rhodobacter sp.]|nr:glycosyltransferase [Rhodobacter sp.]